MKLIASVDDAQSLVGEELGVSSWLCIDQDCINRFADVTGDHQWIHVDLERARRQSPYGAPIAHGFLTLALLPALSNDVFQLKNLKFGLNYGLNKVRFLSGLPVGSRIRARSKLADVTARGDGMADLVVEHTIEIEGSDKPAVFAELILRVVF